MIMQCSKALLIFYLLFSGVIIAEEPDKRLVSELTIAELKETVRDIVQDSIENCIVKGTMEGRAKINLKVEGEVIAQMECNFEDNASTDNG